MNTNHLDYLISVYDSSTKDNLAYAHFTKEELKKQYFMNALLGKETTLTAINTNKYNGYAWELKISSY